MKVALNGFCRIGRLVFRILEEDDNFEVVAINNMSDTKQTAYLLKYDSIHGSYKKDSISYDEENIIIDGKKVRVFSEKDPVNLLKSNSTFIFNYSKILRDIVYSLYHLHFLVYHLISS